VGSSQRARISHSAGVSRTSAANDGRQKGDKMTADRIRTLSSCAAALFISLLLVTAATSPLAV
jgi:hypothetical protein